MDGTAMRVVVRIPIGALRGAQNSEQAVSLYHTMLTSYWGEG